jgi:hypothetical protein
VKSCINNDDFVIYEDKLFDFIHVDDLCDVINMYLHKKICENNIDICYPCEKKLLSEIKKNTGMGEKNSQYGTCWVTKNNINKKIKKEELNQFIQKGWIKGRFFKKK